MTVAKRSVLYTSPYCSRGQRCVTNEQQMPPPPPSTKRFDSQRSLAIISLRPRTAAIHQTAACQRC